MYGSGIFVFGTKIFEEPDPDAISCLPLELSWKIFSYLDKVSLRNATRVHKVWKRMIIANRTLRRRLNHFELVLKYGSEKRLKFHKRNKRIAKKKKLRNYLPVGDSAVVESRTITSGNKRAGENFTICVKRYKLF